MKLQANAFYTNPRLTILMVGFLIIMGAMAFLSLARQEDPSMTERWARVNTFLPGATASRMESLVSEPIETALREIPEIKEITSTSKAGFSVVGIELYDSVGPESVDTIWSEVRDELGDITPSLPDGVSEPELILNKPLASTLIIALSWQQDTPMELNLLSRVAESLRLKLANIPGTEIAESWGEAEEELLVSVDPYRLANSGISTTQLAANISRADTKLPSGRLRSAGSDMLVEVEAELSTPERIASIPIAVSAAGSTIRVSDVADVRKSRIYPPTSMALHQQQPVILVNAKMQPGLQIATWTSAAQAVIDDYQQNLPGGIGLDVVYNQSEYTGQRMDDLATNLMFALVIVLLVLIWFMGVRSALTVGVALPLSAAMVLLGMQFLNVPLHQMSVTGLIISLGLLIDNAIVVVEDYKLRRRAGTRISLSIEKAVRHLLIPLGASTATTVFAFMPIALAPGGVGDFTGTIGVTVALSVASSFFLAMTVVPSIAGFLENRWPTREGHRWWQAGFSHPKLTQAYRASIMTALRKPVFGIGVACILPLIGFALAPTLTQQFFPPVDRNQFQVQLSLPPHASIF
ncbi:MAG: efflux RND transporter permease subunit, partial [Pseudomonadota bacterium]